MFYFPYPLGEAAQITNDLDSYRNVSLTSDGKTIGAVRTSVDQALWFLPSEGGTPRPIVPRSRSEGYSNLRPLKNGRIAFGANKDRHQQIWWVNRDGTGRHQITDLPGWSFDLRSLPDGASLAFTHFAESESAGSIWRVDVDGGNLRRLTKGSGEFLRDVSPDGRTVLYARADRIREIWRVPAGGGETELFLEDASSPDYSPDGRLLVYSVQREIEGRIRNVWQVIPADGGEVIMEIIPPGDAGNRRWVPDSGGLTYLHLENNAHNIWKHSIESDETVQVTGFGKGRIADYKYSPDGSMIGLVRVTSGVPQFWTVRPDGTEPTPRTQFPTGVIFDMEWDPDNGGIFLRQGDISREVVLITRAE